MYHIRRFDVALRLVQKLAALVASSPEASSQMCALYSVPVAWLAAADEPVTCPPTRLTVLFSSCFLAIQKSGDARTARHST